MDVKQETFDYNTEIIKMELDLVSDQMDENDRFSTTDKTFKNDQDCALGDTGNICEYQTTRKLINIDEIKQEYEQPKIEGSDFLENIEYESVRDNGNNFSKIIKKEPENVDGVKEADKKPMISKMSEYIQFKDESELLTSHCDLPTLKSEVEVPDYLNDFAEPCSSKQTIIKSKLSKHIVRNFPKQKKQKTFRLSRKNPFNAQFGRFYETCFYCGQFFLTKSQFLFHFIVIHYVKKVTKFCKQKFGHKHCRCKNCLHTIFRHRPAANIFPPEEKLLQCEICMKQFTSKRYLKLHLNVHNGEKPYKCEICSKQFTEKCNLKMHIKIHIGEKPFHCEICWKQFTLKGSLKWHLKFHTGERAFKCEICSKQFIQKSHLEKHLRLHTGEKPFKCEICSKPFSEKSYLKEHSKIHKGEKPFMCDICSKQFIKKENLKTHLRIHTGEKPFTCKICSKPFNHQSDLKKHLQIHTGEKPFKCEICSKHFSQKGDLKMHLRTNSHRRKIDQL